MVANMKGKILFFNRAAEKLTGFHEEEIVDKAHITKFYSKEKAKVVAQLCTLKSSIVGLEEENQKLK